PDPAKYVVARFWPCFVTRPLESASASGRGSSFLSQPSRSRICSARRPSGCFATRSAISSTILPISSIERRIRRPPLPRRTRDGGRLRLLEQLEHGRRHRPSRTRRIQRIQRHERHVRHLRHERNEWNEWNVGYERNVGHQRRRLLLASEGRRSTCMRYLRESE